MKFASGMMDTVSERLRYLILGLLSDILIMSVFRVLLAVHRSNDIISEVLSNATIETYDSWKL